MTIEKLDASTPDLTQQNIERLLELFPECRTEGAREDAPMVDFDLLRQALSDYLVEGPAERYRLDWPGKRQALLTANTPIDKTLRPMREESVDFDTTRNLFIEGDNLDALKLLQETYLGKVKMIYIDPPYNTGKDFIYRDNFGQSRTEYEEKSEQRNDDGSRLIANPDSNGRFHSNWLNMIYPRLKLAKHILADDGMIFVSIDDNEFANLNNVLGEIFSLDESLSVHHIQVRYASKSLNERKDFQELLEHILIFSKDKKRLNLNKPRKEYPIEKFNLGIEHQSPPTRSVEKHGRKMDIWEPGSFSIVDVAPSIEGFKETWISGSILTGTGHGKMYTKMIDSRLSEDGNGCLYRIHGIGEDGLGYRYYTNPTDPSAARGKMYTKVPLVKREQIENGDAFKESPIVNFYDYAGAFGNIRHEGGVPFNGGKKPVSLLKQLVSYFDDDDFIALDFFAGSASLAEAVISQNASDGGTRTSILVQLDEKIADDDAVLLQLARDANIEPTISAIGRERIRRVGAKILNENSSLQGKLDTGFRAFRIDSGNFADTSVTPKEATQEALAGMVSHIKDDRGEEDLLFGALLRWGVDITLPIEQRELAGRTVWLVDAPPKDKGNGTGKGAALIACFVKPGSSVKGGIDTELADAMAELAPLRVLFRDDGFADDATKENVHSRFKQLAPDTQVRVL